MLSVGAIRFEDRFCASRKGGTGGDGKVPKHEISLYMRNAVQSKIKSKIEFHNPVHSPVLG